MKKITLIPAEISLMPHARVTMPRIVETTLINVSPTKFFILSA
jgi:hypothetical protein